MNGISISKAVEGAVNARRDNLLAKAATRYAGICLERKRKSEIIFNS